MSTFTANTTNFVDEEPTAASFCAFGLILICAREEQFSSEQMFAGNKIMEISDARRCITVPLHLPAAAVGVSAVVLGVLKSTVDSATGPRFCTHAHRAHAPSSSFYLSPRGGAKSQAKVRTKPARTETRNIAPRQGAWGAGRLRPPERSCDKPGESLFFCTGAALDSKSEK